MIAAAAVITRAVRARPFATASWVRSWPRYSSCTREAIGIAQGDDGMRVMTVNADKRALLSLAFLQQVRI
jgi:hypothetical protein